MAIKYKLLFLSHSANMFGAERSLLDLVIGLDRSRFDPVVILPALGPLHDELTKNGIQTLIVPYKNWVGADYFLLCPYRTAFNLVSFARYKYQLKKLNPDLIYTNTSVFPFGGVLARWLKLPHIWHLREFVEKDIGANFYYGRKTSLRFIDRSSQKVICNSEALRRDVFDLISSDKLVTVYNGILNQSDIKSYQPKAGVSSQRHHVLCMIGSIAPHKGHAEALKALALLRVASGLNITLRIVGSGPPQVEKRLKRLTQKLSLDEVVKWEGYQSNVTELYRQADATLVCSRHEPFGRVAVESMAVGTPVIGTAAGGLPEIITDGVTGLLYSPGAYETLAHKIQQLLSDDKLYEMISAESQKSVFNRFTKQQYIDKIETILESAFRK